MTPFRRETKIYSNQPVRFYKFVALSFLLITIVLFGAIIFMSSKRATVTITTKETPVEASFLVSVADSLGAQSVTGEAVTVDVSLTRTFNPKGTKQENGIATGVITIYNDSGTDQPLVATTRFLTKDKVLFRLKNRELVQAGGTVDAEVYADVEGASGNIGPSDFTIPGLNENRQKEVYGKSTDVMSGGVRTIGILDDDDLETAEKQLLELVKTEGESIIDSQKEDGQSGVYSVRSFEKVVGAEVGEEVSGFDMTIDATVLGVLYSDADVSGLADSALKKRVVDDTEVIRSAETVPTVTLEDYDTDTREATLSIFYDGVASLNPDSKQLEKMMFFGKNRDEIRRYVLSLDHVHSVDVKFSPAWIQNAPHVNDHVNVVVKNVK